MNERGSAKATSNISTTRRQDGNGEGMIVHSSPYQQADVISILFLINLSYMDT